MLLTDLCDQLRVKQQEINNIFPYWMNDSCIAEVRFSQKTLRTIISILTHDPAKEVNQYHIDLLVQFLDNRWQRIMNTNLAYPNANQEPITNVCLYIAKIIKAHGNNKNSIFKILMPTITTETNALSLTSLHDREMLLNHFVLTDDNARYIDVADCLNQAQNDGILKETAIDRPLTSAESNRIICHSRITKAYYKLIMLRKTLNSSDNDIGKRLRILYEKLTKSSTRKGGEGTETMAGQSAYDGILEFREWLSTLNEEEKMFLFSLTSSRNRSVNFGEIWQHLSQTYDSSIANKIDCTNILSFEILHILEDNPKLFGRTEDGKSILDLNVELEQNRIALEKALGKADSNSMENQNDYLVNSGYDCNIGVQFNTPDFLYSSLNASSQVLSVVKLLPEESRLSALQAITEKSWQQIQWKASDFVETIKLLSLEERYIYLSKNHKKIFSTMRDDNILTKILAHLSQVNVKDFFAEHRKDCLSLINTGKTLIRVLKIVDIDLRKSILKDIGSRLPELIQDQHSLKKILKLFPFKQRLEVLERVFDSIQDFDLSLSEVNRYVLLIDDNKNKNKKDMKQTLVALQAYASYPSIHKNLLKIINQAFQKDRVQKKTHGFFGGRYNPEKDYKITLAKQMDLFLDKKLTIFAPKKPKGRIGAIIKHAKNYLSY